MQWSEENRELKETVRSGTFDESAFEKDEDEVEAVIGVPTSLQVVLTCLVSFLQTGTNLIPLKNSLWDWNESSSSLIVFCLRSQLQEHHWRLVSVPIIDVSVLLTALKCSLKGPESKNTNILETQTLLYNETRNWQEDPTNTWLNKVDFWTLSAQEV